MTYERATLFSERSIKPPANLIKEKQRLWTPSRLEREAKLRRHEIKMRIDELRGFILRYSRKDHYHQELIRWRRELVDLHAQLL
jgi:hypothetical protein